MTSQCMNAANKIQGQTEARVFQPPLNGPGRLRQLRAGFMHFLVKLRRHADNEGGDKQHCGRKQEGVMTYHQ